MTAETLRRAAALMRERAEAASPGPWTHGHEGLQGGEVIRSGEIRIARVYKATWPDYVPDCENASHIASWHPAIALAVADWLERVADDEPSWSYAHAQTEAESALAVARAYLGEDGS